MQDLRAHRPGMTGRQDRNTGKTPATAGVVARECGQTVAMAADPVAADAPATGAQAGQNASAPAVKTARIPPFRRIPMAWSSSLIVTRTKEAIRMLDA